MDNTVQLIGYYGGDVLHACSAWTSTSRNLTEEKRARIPKLLADLAKNGHETPFEKSSLHFLVNSDIASHIHLLKHRIGVSINAESARYKELKEDKAYIPKVLDSVKIGKHQELKDWTVEGDTWADVLSEFTTITNKLYHACLKDVESGFGRKRAKEVSRYFKMYNSQIESDIMFNFRSFVHFQRLRNSPEAQWEIEYIAHCMLELVQYIKGDPFKHSLEAFGL